MKVTIDIPNNEHAAMMRRVQGLQQRQCAHAGGNVPASERIGISEYLRTLARADLHEHFRRLEAEARARAARAVAGEAARVAA